MYMYFGTIIIMLLKSLSSDRSSHCNIISKLT